MWRKRRGSSPAPRATQRSSHSNARATGICDFDPISASAYTKAGVDHIRQSACLHTHTEPHIHRSADRASPTASQEGGAFTVFYFATHYRGANTVRSPSDLRLEQNKLLRRSPRPHVSLVDFLSLISLYPFLSSFLSSLPLAFPQRLTSDV